MCIQIDARAAKSFRRNRGNRARPDGSRLPVLASGFGTSATKSGNRAAKARWVRRRTGFAVEDIESINVDGFVSNRHSLFLLSHSVSVSNPESKMNDANTDDDSS